MSPPQRDVALQGVHILSVEDQSDMREYIQRILDEYGATVTTAASAGEALELLRADTCAQHAGNGTQCCRP